MRIVDIERLKISENQMLGIFKMLELLGPDEDHILLNDLNINGWRLIYKKVCGGRGWSLCATSSAPRRESRRAAESWL